MFLDVNKIALKNKIQGNVYLVLANVKGTPVDIILYFCDPTFFVFYPEVLIFVIEINFKSETVIDAMATGKYSEKILADITVVQATTYPPNIAYVSVVAFVGPTSVKFHFRVDITAPTTLA